MSGKKQGVVVSHPARWNRFTLFLLRLRDPNKARQVEEKIREHDEFMSRMKYIHDVQVVLDYNLHHGCEAVLLRIQEEVSKKSHDA